MSKQKYETNERKHITYLWDLMYLVSSSIDMAVHNSSYFDRFVAAHHYSRHCNKQPKIIKVLLMKFVADKTN